MNILANVTYSLINDYNDIVDHLSRNINGDTYFTTTLVSNIDRANFNINNYDMIINFINDENDILDDYFYLYDEAVAHGMVNNFLVYYKKNESYENEAVYYSKKDANKQRKHRFLEYIDTNEVIFDLMVHAGLYFGADINIRKGKLRLKNYDVVELGRVRFLNSVPLLSKHYKKVCVARDELTKLVNKATIDDDEILLSIERIQKYMDSVYIDYDRTLEHAIALYKEIIYSFANSEIAVLDYIFAKEYYEIGHFTSISSCFHRDCYKNIVDDDEYSFENTISILKMIVYSMSFADNNEFVIDIIKSIFDMGKQYELKCGRDDFFYYFAHDFAVKIGDHDLNYDKFKMYIDLIEKGILEPKRQNVYNAYIRLSNHALDIGDIDSGKKYAEKALAYTSCDIEIVRACKILFSIERINANTIGQQKYMDMANQYIYLMDNGYHNEYANYAITLMSALDKDELNIDWFNTIIDKAIDCKYLEKESYYYLYLKKMFDFENGMSEDDRLDGLKYIAGEMISNFYVKPTITYVGIYNSLLVLAKLFEDTGDERNASTCYKRAYRYLSLLENIHEDTDEKIAYVQYKIGDIALNMDSSRSYRELARAERRMYQYIKKTHKYVEFYGDLLKKITERYLEDNRRKIGVMISQNHLSKLIDCCSINEEYLKDTARYCRKMVETFKDYGLNAYIEDYTQLADNYDKICREKGLI